MRPSIACRSASCLVDEKKETVLLPHKMIHFSRTFVSSRLVRLAAIVSAVGVGLCLGTPAVSKVYDLVEVRGDQFIPEADIRMTCGAEAGVDYLEAELRAIEECLMSTGVFNSVVLIAENSTLVIQVEEINTQPGRLDVSVGYASQDGLLANLSVEKYNLFDRTYGALSLDFGPNVRRATANLYRTEAFESELDLGVEIVAGRLNYEDTSYVHEAIRAESYLAWPLSSTTRLEGGVGIRDHRLTDVEPGASALLFAEETSGITAPYVRFSLRHLHEARGKWRDFGYSLRVNQYFWNIGTDDLLSDTRVEARMKVPLSSKLRLVTGIHASTIAGLRGNATRAIDRYFSSADSFRGFASRGIGPRDGDDALGGNTFLTTTVELQRDFGEVFKIPFQGGVFVDAGASWGLDNTLGGAIDDGWHLRSTVGASLNFDVSGTPISIYVATPLSKEDGDETQLIGLSLRASF